MYADDITLVANLSTFCINKGLNIDININNELALLSDWLKLKDDNPIRFAHQEDTQ